MVQYAKATKSGSQHMNLDSEGNPYGEIDLESEEDICDEEGNGSKNTFCRLKH